MRKAQRTSDILRDIQASIAEVDGTSVGERLVHACASRISRSGVAITWASRDAEPLTIASTPGLARAMDDIQFTFGEGPQVDCARGRRAVLAPNIESGEARKLWPHFAPEALVMGVTAAFAFPLSVGAIGLGVLGIYRLTSGSLESTQLADALAYAEAATTILLQRDTPGDPLALPLELEQPFALQAEVHQATGMVSVQASTDLRSALVLLRAHAFAAGRSVDDVSKDVVTRVLRFD